MKIPNKEKPRVQSLKNIAIFLEGYKRGKGDVLPLGTKDLNELWSAIKYIQNEPD